MSATPDALTRRPAVSYPVSAIAGLLDITESHVQTLVRQGVLPKAARGRYELAPVVQAYVKYLRDRSLRGDAANADVLASKHRLLKARARAAELEADMLERATLKRSEVDRAWTQIIEVVRARMLAIPFAASEPGFAAVTQLELSSILTKAVHDALEDAARTPIHEAPASVPCAGAAGQSHAEDLDAADEADRLEVG